MNNFAVLDLGTNTFHLLIVKKTPTLWDEIYRKRVFVNIASGGIDTLSAECYNRGIETVLQFQNKLEEFDVEEVRVFGTAALRTASNGSTFCTEVKQRTGLEIHIIDGKREAELISKGTKAVVDMSRGNYLIMDIGGGSVEFILIRNEQDEYAQSFPIGITSLYNELPHGEPISQSEINRINQYLSDQLKPLIEKIKNLTIEGLVGASGSYEVLEKILSGSIAKNKASCFEINQILEQIAKIIRMDLNERLSDPNIPEQRAKLLVVAVLLMKYVISITTVNQLIISPFALKEGALIEMMNLD